MLYCRTTIFFDRISLSLVENLLRSMTIRYAIVSITIIFEKIRRRSIHSPVITDKVVQRRPGHVWCLTIHFNEHCVFCARALWSIYAPILNDSHSFKIDSSHFIDCIFLTCSSSCKWRSVYTVCNTSTILSKSRNRRLMKE